MLVFPLCLVLNALLLFGLKELRLLSLWGTSVGVDFTVVEISKFLFLVSSKGFNLSYEIDVLTFEALVHVTVVDDFFDVISEV